MRYQSNIDRVLLINHLSNGRQMAHCFAIQINRDNGDTNLHLYCRRACHHVSFSHQLLLFSMASKLRISMYNPCGLYQKQTLCYLKLGLLASVSRGCI